MKMKKRILSFFVFLLLTISAVTFLSQSQSVSAQNHDNVVPHEVLVKFKDGVDSREIGNVRVANMPIIH